MTPLFQAVIEATEEAIYNSLFTTTAVTGQGLTIEPLPLDMAPSYSRRRTWTRGPGKPVRFPGAPASRGP
ncbi:hypothetical protein JRI60_24115 [Archangium violaceum]|uniref:P1 family peptidase n=1 Tax=Archangium violaceum TaxID=83451 RepID=UPI0019528A1B|nr:hypothetical protein JRI60_24115 [Archangium violaceum]